MSKTIKRTKEKWGLHFLILLFSIISFYTSYTGLIKLAGIDEKAYILRAFMAILVFGLQFALVYSINAFYLRDLLRKNWVKAIALLLIYLITMTLSVTFSFSYWYETFSAENYAKRNAQLQLNEVKKSLIEAKSSFSTMEKSLTKLSSYSNIKSNYEKTVGGTCGGVAKSGEGPFTWLRADDATYTKSYAKKIKELKDSLNNEIEEVSKYLDTFNPKGDVKAFNRKVNEKILKINIKFFKNPTLGSLEGMLIKRSGKNRQHIYVVSRKTKNHSSRESCVDSQFTFNANRVIKHLHDLKPIAPLKFFDMNDTKRLLGRTTGVLMALIKPSYTIKQTNKITKPTDITYDDIYAVSAGFVIDFLILLITLYGKEPKESLTVSVDVIKDILKGKHSKEILGELSLFLAELHNSYFIALPNDVNDEQIESARLLILYMQQHKLAELYIGERRVNRLNKYFPKALKESYPESSFKIYKINKKKFNKIILQNIEAGVYHV